MDDAKRCDGAFGMLPRLTNAIRCMIPHCLMWGLWREKNARTFEGCEKPSHYLKLLFLRTLFEWGNALGLFSFYSLLDVIDSCFSSVILALLMYMFCVHGYCPFFSSLINFFLSKKKKATNMTRHSFNQI